MKYKYMESKNGAINLLEIPSDFEVPILIKIEPEQRECCCLRHWKNTWIAIDDYILPDGPITGEIQVNEGNALIQKDGIKYVLECHESGPEIIIYLSIISNIIGLIKSVADLLVFILKTRLHENPSCTYQLRTYGSEGILLKEEKIEFPINTKKDLENFIADSIICEIHENISLLINRMEADLDRNDYAGVLHCSACIFETMAKDIEGIPNVKNQTLKSFFNRYCKDSSLPREILDYIISIYEQRNIMPLAGHGSTMAPTINKQEAISLSELTKAFVKIEYKLRI